MSIKDSQTTRPQDFISWNYRVFVESSDIDQPSYSIRTVYYDEKGNPTAFGEEGYTPEGDSLKDLEEEIDLMKQAFDNPAFDLNNFPALCN